MYLVFRYKFFGAPLKNSTPEFSHPRIRSITASPLLGMLSIYKVSWVDLLAKNMDLIIAFVWTGHKS